MNVVELQRALRQLRCSGIAAGLEVRLLEAQAEKLAGSAPRTAPEAGGLPRRRQAARYL